MLMGMILEGRVGGEQAERRSNVRAVTALAAAIFLTAAAHGLGAEAAAKTGTAAAGGMELVQIVSREDPAFDIARSRLAIGRNGIVYLASGDYVLSLDREGEHKLGGKVTYATTNVAANKDGVIATANAHFNHCLSLWSPAFEKLGTATDFLVSDQVEWQAPGDVQVGSSGDFFGTDQNRDRIVRVAAPGRMVTTYSLAGTGESFIRKLPQFRVWEPGHRFYILNEKGEIVALDFDGKKLWSIPAGIGGNPWDGYRGGFDVDDAGKLYVMRDTEDAVKIFDPESKPVGQIQLHMGAAKGRIAEMRLFGDDVVIKRQDPVELFQVYDRSTGTLRRAVLADVERLKVRYPGDVWTAGQAVPLTIEFDSGKREIRPQWRVWLRPANTPNYTELALVNGHVTAPAGMTGLCQLKIGAGLQGGDAEYQVQSFVEIREPGAIGSLSIFTPLNRIYYGQGEEIPLTILCRAAKPDALPKQIAVHLYDSAHSGQRDMAVETVSIELGKPARLVLPKTLTSALRPGRYWLMAQAKGFTVAGQSLDIGPGIRTPPAFGIVEHGDYTSSFPTTKLFDTSERVATHLERTLKLGTNMFVDRLGHGGAGGLDAMGGKNEDAALSERLKKDPLAVAVEKAQFENSVHQSIAAYGANGIEQRAILLYMDAGLPVGTGFDARKPEEYVRDITRVSKDLADYPALRGWSWAANWWIGNLGAAAATSPEQKKAYEAAVKKARETGAWDPVLDQVSDAVLHNAVAAERQFNATLQRVVPGKLSVMTGPYRAVGVIPPITFRNADEVDLQYQSEQIQPPQVTPHNVDFYKLPGKRAWGHPELWNDEGTGGMIGPTLMQMVMRGADGVGWSGPVPSWGTPPSDPRATGMGAVSVFRSMNGLLKQYGPWLTTLHNNDRVALVVSQRMLRLDEWTTAIGGTYFTRLFEAYNALLYAHRPATFVFSEDIKPDALGGYKAVLVVDQQVEPEVALAAALEHARQSGCSIFYDQTCRKELVKPYKPLGLAFNRVEKDPGVWQDDSAYDRFPGYFEAEAAMLDEALRPIVEPVATVDDPAIMLTERTAGSGRFVWMVNNKMLGLDPGLAWRVGLLISNRLPTVASVDLHAAGHAVYDVFALAQIEPVKGRFSADMRSMPARLFAILPKPIANVAIHCSKEAQAGRAFGAVVFVLDGAGKPIDSNIPLRLRLLAADGTLLEERFTQAADGRSVTNWTLPLNTATGPVKLEAVELFGGKKAKVSINVVDRALPVPFGALTESTIGPSAPAVDTSASRSRSLPAAQESFGPHLKEITVSADGSQALLNAMTWDANLYRVDVRDGRLIARSRLGHHFAYGPQAAGDSFAVQGFDLNTAEGYHLYLLGKDGTPSRRFALYGLPKRATAWAAGWMLLDRINQFAVAPDGHWVAASGDLGLAVWDRNGRELWRQNWWKTLRQRIHLFAADSNTLVTLHEMTATAYRAADGAKLWQITLARSGALQDGVASAGGRVLALRADTQGGRVYVLRDGKLANTLFTPADAMSLSPDGSQLAVTTANQLKWYATARGLEWTFTGDDTLRGPHIAPDGRRVAVGSELGSLYVLDSQGELLHERDQQALPTMAWLADGDLLVATWMGAVLRLDGKYAERWRTRLDPPAGNDPIDLRKPDQTPTTRIADWGNAAATTASLVPNLLKDARTEITAVAEPAPGQVRPWRFPIERLIDGKSAAPPEPWLDWTDINYIDSGWRGSLDLVFDTYHTQLSVTGITFVEDPQHPESWLRDMRLQSWDAAKEQWRDGPYLLSNSATHTHWFERPVEAARFRLVSTGGGSWPVGNVRLAQIAFHGKILGGSHPDVVAKRPLAVLFDEKESDLKALVYGDQPFIFKYDDAYSGGKCLALTRAGHALPAYHPPFGHAIPHWNFEIAENPQPGQYRWIQFAWKASGPQTTGMSLLITRPWPGGGCAFVAGKYKWSEGVLASKQVADTPPREWQVVRADLWEMLKKPIQLEALGLAAEGGGAEFDQIVLGRTEKDLPPVAGARTQTK
jgi:hypothetical protein